jgi:hypothetical protein
VGVRLGHPGPQRVLAVRPLRCSRATTHRLEGNVVNIRRVVDAVGCYIALMWLSGTFFDGLAGMAVR